MQSTQIHTPSVLNTDKAAVALSETEMFFAMNHDVITIPGKGSPMPANYLGCDIVMPAGDNYSIGSYYSNLTNETYVFVGNTNNAPFIYRMNGDGTCEIVNHSSCLQSVFGTVADGVFNPKHSFEQWRVRLRVDKLCSNRHGKALIFTNGLGDIGCIDVEASIATDSFSTPFFDRCEVGCETVELCVPQSCGCITAEFLPLDESERGFTNKVVDIGFKFMYRHVYYDLRASEWSDVSTLYYQDSRSCFANTEGFPRCLELTIPLGNPLVDKIEIAYSTDGGTNWFLADTVDKYESYSSLNKYWYDRDISVELNLTTEGCSFKYKFCNDKQCQPIAPENIRAFNPQPRKSQGFVGIQEVEGYFNFESGTCPLDRAELDKPTIEINCIDTNNCEPKYVDVTVRAIVHNWFYNSNTPIYRGGGDLNIQKDAVGDTAYFGTNFGLSFPTGKAGVLGEPKYNSYFTGKERNFVVYIEGTNQFVEMKQWKVGPGFFNKEETGIISGLNSDTINVLASRDGDKYYFQEATFRVKKGTKGFLRIKGHLSKSRDDDSSTFIRAVLNDIGDYRVNSDIGGLSSTSFQNEIYFDASAGDVDIRKTFLIENPVKSADLFNHSSVLFFGYLKLQDGTPIEKAELWSNTNEKWMETDHNGFFFRSFDGLGGMQPFSVRVERGCVGGFTEIKSLTLSGGYGAAHQNDITLLDSETIDYKDYFFANADVKVIDCTNAPVSGVRIAMSGSKARTTDVYGIAHFEVRNNSSRNRVLTAIVMDNGGCLLVNCVNECNPSLPSQSNTGVSCYGITSGGIYIVFSDMKINTSQLLLSDKGLKKGGRYIFAGMARSACGRISAAYELATINIPKIQETGVRKYCSFTYNMNGINLPAWVDCFDILRTENINPFELQWIIDKIEKVNGKIRLTIQSLNDYNESFNFKTNTIYKYLKGDRVEFIENGDGKIFNITANGLLNYATLSSFNDSDNTEFDYFNQLVIEDDNRLDDLKKGAIIEIQREKVCTTEPVFHSICVSIPIVDGHSVNSTGTFSTFDTFLVSRNIGEFYQKIFEHHSPSDFWGDKLSDVGKAYFANKYENERRFGRSYILNFATEFNRFDSRLIKTLDSPNHGDITASYVIDGKILIAIGEFDTDTAQVSDTLVRIGNDGLVRASQPDQIISDGEPKTRGQFGCKYASIGSIYFGDGFATFIDIDKAAYVKHNYAVAEDVSENKIKTYLKEKTALIQYTNSQTNDYLQHYRFSTGINKITNVIFLTMKKLSHTGINNSSALLSSSNETITFYPLSNEFLSPVSFTPESYSVINLTSAKGCAFVCFQNGLPYITPVVPDKWNEFFGVACDWMVGIVINKYKDKIKHPLASEIQDADMLWYVKKVTTEEDNWQSEVPVIRAARRGDKVNLSYLSNINSRGGLYGDDKAKGYITKVLFLRDNTLNLAYGTEDVEKKTAYSELGLIISKFFFKEQSGYSNSNK